MTGTDLITNLIQKGSTGFLILEPRKHFDPGCVGYVEKDNRLIYDLDLLAKSLSAQWVEDNEVSEEESLDLAYEFLHYNLIRSLPYQDNPPVIISETETESV